MVCGMFNVANWLEEQEMLSIYNLIAPLVLVCCMYYPVLAKSHNNTIEHFALSYAHALQCLMCCLGSRKDIWPISSPSSKSSLLENLARLGNNSGKLTR